MGGDQVSGANYLGLIPADLGAFRAWHVSKDYAGHCNRLLWRGGRRGRRHHVPRATTLVLSTQAMPWHRSARGATTALKRRALCTSSSATSLRLMRMRGPYTGLRARVMSSTGPATPSITARGQNKAVQKLKEEILEVCWEHTVAALDVALDIQLFHS